MYVKTIEVPDTMVSVTTDENYKYYWIRNLGEKFVGVFKNSSGTGFQGFHAVVGPRECVKVIPEGTTLYFASANEGTTNKIEIYGTNTADCPFEGKAKGGDGGGDNTHYKGTTTTPLENGSTTNPIVIDGESYTAVFGDVVVYGYTEFIFDGTQWSEFGRPFDTVPTQGSTNAVTSDGIYKRTPFARSGKTGAVLGNNTANGGNAVAVGSFSQANGGDSLAAGYSAYSTGAYSSALGFNVSAKGYASHVVGKNNNYGNNDLFEIGNGTNPTHLSNLVEANNSRFNVNCALQINNVPIPIPYTTMPTITESMLGQIAMYVGTTGGGFTQGCFYVASTDGAAEPTYSWVQIGGDSGGYSETVLWEYTGSKPTTMVLSQPVTDFDVIITYGADNGNEYAFQPTVHLVSEIQKGLLFGVGIANSDARQWYDYVNATTFEINRFMNKPYLPIKVVGVKLSSGGEGSTKTTNYSTDEQVIGTWIDGSILYQKTYTGISLNNNSWNIGVIDTTGKTVRDIRGYITTETCTVDINYYRSSSEFVTTVWDIPSLNILTTLSASDFGTLTATITIQYTKSSA